MNLARIDNGTVAEIIPPFMLEDGTPQPAEERFPPALVAMLVAVPEGLDVQQGWTYDGKKFAAPEPVEDVPVVPHSVTKRQATLALYDAGKYDAVMHALSQDQRANLEWMSSATVERSSPLVLQLGEGLGLDLDALFIHAATL